MNSPLTHDVPLEQYRELTIPQLHGLWFELRMARNENGTQ